jgi:hypothetical protein
MPQKYTPDQKTAVMVLLERAGGNVPLVSQRTGIPVRTLYNWQCQLLPHLQQYAPFVPNPAETLAFDDDLSALAFIRKQIMDEMIRISSSLKNDNGITTPYQRVLVLSQLMDKMMKLDLHLKPYVPADEDIEYVLTDDVEEVDDDEYDGIYGSDPSYPNGASG